MLAIGWATLIWQVGSARAIMAGLHGNELVLGLVFGAWLALTGLGSALATLARRRPRLRRRSLPEVAFDGAASRPASFALLAAVLLLAPAAVLASMLLQQAGLPAFQTAGQISGPGRAALAALVCLAPPCLLFGAAFGLAAQHLPPSLLRPIAGAARGSTPAPAPGVGPAAYWAGGIYALECLGTIAAGIAFHLWLARLPLSLCGLAAALPPWLVGVAALARAAPAGRMRLGPVALTGVVALLYLAGMPGLPGSAKLQPEVPGYRILTRISSQHAELSVIGRGDQILFLANGLVLFSNQDDEQAESEVHATLLAHPAPRRLLFVGGGLGGGLREALRHPVEQIDYVELDPALPALVRAHGGPTLVAPLDDPRVRLVLGDGRRVVARERAAYDVILVGLPGPSSALVNRFYTEGFFAAAKAALRPGGLVRVTLEGSETYLSDASAQVHTMVKRAMESAFGHAVALPGQSTLLLAGREGAPELTLATLGSRLRERELELRRFGFPELASRTLSFRREQYERRLEGIITARNTDLRPAAHFHATLDWLAVSSPALSRALAGLTGAIAERPALAIAGAFAVSLLLGLLWRRRAGAAWAALLAGFSGLSVQMGLMIAAQEIRGVIYHELGALLTAVMAGMALGALGGARLVAAVGRQSLRLALGGCALAALAAAGALHAALASPAFSLPAFLLSLSLLGGAVGATFPAAAAAAAAAATAAAALGAGTAGRAQSRSGLAAARVYAWDLTGAAAGAVLAAWLVLPALGLAGTAFFCAALCAGFALAHAAP